MQKIIKLLKDTDFLAVCLMTFVIICDCIFLYFKFGSLSEEIIVQLIWILSVISIAIITIWIAIILNKKGKSFNVPNSSLVIRLCMLSSICFLIDVSDELVELARSIDSQYIYYIIFVKNLMVVLSVFISLRGGEIFKIK